MILALARRSLRWEWGEDLESENLFKKLSVAGLKNDERIKDLIRILVTSLLGMHHPY